MSLIKKCFCVDWMKSEVTGKVPELFSQERVSKRFVLPFFTLTSMFSGACCPMVLCHVH